MLGCMAAYASAAESLHPGIYGPIMRRNRAKAIEI